MALKVLEGSDVVSAKEGTAYLILEGRNIPLFYAMSVSAKIKKDKKQIKSLGSRMAKHKTTGAEGTGTLKIFEVTSIFKEIIWEYVKNGKDLYFNIMVTNEDPTTDYGRETKVLYNCNFDEVDVADLDGEGDFLQQEMSFTFDDFDLPEKFTEASI